MLQDNFACCSTSTKISLIFTAKHVKNISASIFVLKNIFSRNHINIILQVDWVKAIPFVGTGVCAIETIKAAANGNGKQALIKLAETGFSGAMDAVTVVTAGAGGIATFSAKTAGKVAASAAIKNVAGVTLVRTVGTTLLDKGAEEAVMDGYIDMSSGNRGGSSDSPRNTTSGGSSSTNSRSTTTSGSRSTSNNTGSSGGDDERPKKTPSNHGDDAEEYEEIGNMLMLNF